MATGKRTKKIDVRFTEDEYEIIEKMESTLGVSKTDLVRMRLLENGRAIVINAKEMITAIDSIGAELGRCSNNINQLAKYANILQKKSRLSPQVVDQFNALMAEYLQKQEMLEISLRQAIRAIGR